MAQAKQQYNGEMVVVVLDYHQWSGRKKATPDEFGIDIKGLPEQVLTFGHKKLYDPKRLGVFSKLGRKAERELELVGRKTPLGFLIPPAASLSVASKLDAIKREVYAQKRVELDGFDDFQGVWVDQFPDYKDAILGDKTLKLDFESQLRFEYHVFVVKEVEESDAKAASLISSGFRSVREGVFGMMLMDTVKVASKLSKALQSNERVTDKTFNAFSVLADKLKGMSYYDMRLKPLWEQLTDFLHEVTPSEGKADEAQISRAQEILKVLTDHEEIVRRLDAGEKLVSSVTLSPVQPDLSQLPLMPVIPAPAQPVDVW